MEIDEGESSCTCPLFKPIPPTPPAAQINGPSENPTKHNVPDTANARSFN